MVGKCRALPGSFFIRPVMQISLLILLIAYALLLCWLAARWRSYASFRPSANSPATGHLPIMVVVVGRNESANLPRLLRSLAAQSYPSFSLCYVDDDSADGSPDLVRQQAAALGLRCEVICLGANPTPYRSAKMAGISLAAKQLKDGLILLTDADCEVGPDWVRTFAEYQSQTQADLISGPVTFWPSKGWLAAFQTVEFASLVGSGAVSMILGRPNMCNGANLAYTKSAWEAVGGFGGLEARVSGDDEFMLHKIHQANPRKVQFLKSPQAIVLTAPQPKLSAFIEQRKRWGSKWRYYQNIKTKILAVSVFFFHGLWLLTIGLSLTQYLSGIFGIIIFLIKIFGEFVFVSQILIFLNKRNEIKNIVWVSIFHSFYIVLVGLLANAGKFEWKNRRY